MQEKRDKGARPVEKIDGTVASKEKKENRKKGGTLR